MGDKLSRITNCHIHLFTSAHVPVNYPHPWLNIFKKQPALIRLFAWVCRILGQQEYAEMLDRLYRFNSEANKPGQKDIYYEIRKQYPENTRFVVLPMDMEKIGHGPVPVSLRAQHEELAQLANESDGKIIPLATVNPDRKNAFKEIKYAIEDLNFKGLKIYPKLGYSPTHDVLMKEIYPYINDKNMPAMTHCSRGGVRGKYVDPRLADKFTDPKAYIPVLEKFKNMRLCLAHFGGQDDWHQYVNEGLDPDDEFARTNNWQVAIRDMIYSGKYENLWTDISYTLFHFEDNIPFLKLFLHGEEKEDDLLRSRVLFGSDYYMTRQERLSERAVCFRLRNELGEEVFRQIAETNPDIWLGSASPKPKAGTD